MYKQLLVILCTFLCVGAVSAQSSILVNTSDTIRVDTTITASAGHVMESFTLKNNSTTDTLKMNWRVVYSTIPHTDTFSFCDPTNCWASSAIGNTIRYTMLPQQSGFMKLDFAPQCVNTNLVFKVHTWASNDSANTDLTMTWVYNIATQCANGISVIDPSQIAIYPNPVRDEMKLILPGSLENGQIDVYNLIGSKVFSQSVSGREKELDLSALETGIYVARISDNGKIIATRKFTKTE